MSRGPASGLFVGEACSERNLLLQKTSSLAYRPEIDGLRFIAITLVLFFHLGFSDWKGGFTGVDIFFVLSGYLICGQIYVSLQRNQFSVVDFFARRIRRLSTATFACFLTIGITCHLLFTPFEMNMVVRNMLGGITFTNNFLLMQESGYFGPSTENNPLLHTWSLSIEEQFYIISPIVLALLRFRARSFLVFLGLAFGISLLLTLFSKEVLYSQEARYFSSLLRVWEIALGGLTFIALQNMTRPIKFVGLPVLGLGAMVAPTFLMNEAALHPGPWALVTAFATSVMLLSAFPIHSMTGRVLASGVPRYLGKISFGTYLWHWPIVVFYQYVGGDFNDKTRAVAILVSFGIGALSHHLIEQPVRKISSQKRRGLLLGLFVIQTLVLAGMAGLLWMRGENADPKDYAKYASIIESKEQANDKWDRCWFANSGDDPCTFGVAEPGERPILLWGDSMANSALPAFAGLADVSRTFGTLFTSPNCPPLLGVARDMPNAETCLGMNAKVIEILKKARPTDVYFFARWPHYAMGVRKNRWGEAGEVGFVDSNLNLLNGNTLDVFQDSLDALLKEISPRHRVIVLGAPPEFPFSVPEEMIKMLRFGLPSKQLPRSQYENRAGRTVSVLKNTARANGVRFLDLTRDFCDQMVCYLERDGVPLYSDHVHLSRRGNAVLLALLLTTID